MPKGIKGFQKGAMNPSRKNGTWNKGKPHSPDTKAKISEGIKGKDNPRWNNGIAHHGEGYVFIRSPKHPYKDNRGYVLAHRLVVEKQIRRYLTAIEVVHHLGKKDDNRPHKLMAFKNTATHKLFEAGHKIKLSDIVFDGRKL